MMAIYVRPHWNAVNNADIKITSTNTGRPDISRCNRNKDKKGQLS